MDGENTVSTSEGFSTTVNFDLLKVALIPLDIIVQTLKKKLYHDIYDMTRLVDGSISIIIKGESCCWFDSWS